MEQPTENLPGDYTACVNNQQCPRSERCLRDTRWAAPCQRRSHANLHNPTDPDGHCEYFIPRRVIKT